MSLLAHHCDPFLVAAHPSNVQGDVIDVLPDDFPLDDFPEMKATFAWTRTPNSVEEDKATFLVPGCPASLVQAVRDATTTLMQAQQALLKNPPDPKSLVSSPEQDAVAKALTNLNEAQQATTGWPERACHLDLSINHMDCMAACEQFCTAMRAKTADVKSATDAALVQKCADLGLTVEAAGKIMNPPVNGKTGLAISPDDIKMDAIIAAQRLAQKAIDDPIIAQAKPPEPVVLDKDALAAAIVVK